MHSTDLLMQVQGPLCKRYYVHGYILKHTPLLRRKRKAAKSEAEIVVQHQRRHALKEPLSGIASRAVVHSCVCSWGVHLLEYAQGYIGRHALLYECAHCILALRTLLRVPQDSDQWISSCCTSSSSSGSGLHSSKDTVYYQV